MISRASAVKMTPPRFAGTFPSRRLRLLLVESSQGDRCLWRKRAVRASGRSGTASAIRRRRGQHCLMPFNLRRTTSYKTAWQVEVGDMVGSPDAPSEVKELAREGDRVRISFADGTSHEIDANETLPVVRSE